MGELGDWEGIDMFGDYRICIGDFLLLSYKFNLNNDGGVFRAYLLGRILNFVILPEIIFLNGSSDFSLG